MGLLSSRQGMLGAALLLLPLSLELLETEVRDVDETELLERQEDMIYRMPKIWGRGGDKY